MRVRTRVTGGNDSREWAGQEHLALVTQCQRINAEQRSALHPGQKVDASDAEGADPDLDEVPLREGVVQMLRSPLCERDFLSEHACELGSVGADRIPVGPFRVLSFRPALESDGACHQRHPRRTSGPSSTRSGRCRAAGTSCVRAVRHSIQAAETESATSETEAAPSRSNAARAGRFGVKPDGASTSRRKTRLRRSRKIHDRTL